MRSLIIALACTVALAGCASHGSGPTGSAAYTAEQVALRAAQTLYVAEATFDAASLAAHQAAASGLIDGAPAAAVLDALTKAHNALVVARASYAAGNSILATAQAAAAMENLATAKTTLSEATHGTF